MNEIRDTCALVLAAGLSVRMGKPKMVLPWGKTTVIGAVVAALSSAGLDHILVVTGGNREGVEAALAGTPAKPVFNPRFADGEMLHSIQAGLDGIPAGFTAALVVLGDQPFIQGDTIRQVVAAASENPGKIVVPSYQMRRGHPWLLPHRYWREVLELNKPQTLRDFFQAHASEIEYVTVATASVIQDLDTPEDYIRSVQGGENS